MPTEPPASRPPANNGGASGGSGGAGGGGGGGGIGSTIGGSVLGICARSRANSLSRSASQYLRGTLGGGHAHQVAGDGYATVRPDIEGLSEKYWGEILERTVSSGNLHAMQKSFPHFPYHQHVGVGVHGHVHQVHQPQQHQTTSFSKHSDLHLNMAGNAAQEATAAELSKFSTSEPKLCEHLFHDANCAKSKLLGTAPDAAATASISSVAAKLAAGRSIPDI